MYILSLQLFLHCIILYIYRSCQCHQNLSPEEFVIKILAPLYDMLLFKKHYSSGTVNNECNHVILISDIVVYRNHAFLYT